MIRTLFVAFCMLGSGLAPAAPKIAPARVGEDYGEVDQTKKLNAEIKAKRQEALTLMREFENFQRVETERTDQEMVTRMEGILSSLQEKAAAVGQSMAYDWFIDLSEKSNSGLPFVLYSKQTEGHHYPGSRGDGSDHRWNAC